jgi:hypothetical protein
MVIVMARDRPAFAERLRPGMQAGSACSGQSFRWRRIFSMTAEEANQAERPENTSKCEEIEGVFQEKRMACQRRIETR